MPNERNVWEGPNALKDFLRPGSFFAPLVEITPFVEIDIKGVRIFAKLMFLLPLLNIKGPMVFYMLEEAEKKKLTRGVHTLVENSSGNTAFSLGIVARHFGIKRTISLVPTDIAPGKLENLRIVDVTPILHKDPPNGIELAREMGEREGFLNLGQYQNEDNPALHEKFTAAEIWEQTRGKATIFCAGLGTTGTALGALRFFKKKGAKVKVVGIISSPDTAVPGVRTLKRLLNVLLPWRMELKHTVEVGSKESYRASLLLSRIGILGGPSSGFALAGLLKFLNSASSASLDDMRNDDGEIVATFVCGDTFLPYTDKYSTILDPEDF